MGKEWLYYWSSGSSSSRSSTGYSGGRSRKRERAAEAGRAKRTDDDDDSVSNQSGCICAAVFNLLDFQRFQLPLTHHHSSSFKFKPHLINSGDGSHNFKGVEAPRNSMEVEKPLIEGGSWSSTVKSQEKLHIRLDNQIDKNGGSKTRADGFAPEYGSNSPGTTPNLVARLMGLNVIPDQICSSSSNSSSHRRQKCLHDQHIRSGSCRFRCVSDKDETTIMGGSRSLPETPRMSSARRSDFTDYCHHRLSLQITKEDFSPIFRRGKDLMTSRKDGGRRHNNGDENRSRSMEMVKKLRESFGRTLGTDITNTIIRSKEQLGRNVVFVDDDGGGLISNTSVIKPKKSSSKRVAARTDDQLTTPSWGSPRLGLLESKSKQALEGAGKNRTLDRSSRFSSPALQVKEHKQRSEAVQKSKKELKKKSGVIIRKKQEEQFFRPTMLTAVRANDSVSKNRRKKAGIPLSKELVGANLIPTDLSMKKETSPPATKLPHRRNQVKKEVSPVVTSCSSQPYKQELKPMSAARDAIGDVKSTVSAAASPNAAAAEFQYFMRILKQAGIERGKPVVSFSLSHTLNTSVFQHLESMYHYSSNNPFHCTTKEEEPPKGIPQRCNRKLLFHLVDELMTEFFRRQPWTDFRVYHGVLIDGSVLIDNLWSKIRRLPSADCRVLEDIDALIESDMGGNGFPTPAGYDDEDDEDDEGSESVVKKIGNVILDDLMRDTIACMGLSCLESYNA